MHHIEDDVVIGRFSVGVAHKMCTQLQLRVKTRKDQGLVF